MDLGIEGKKAIVCASSRGLGKACALSLVQEGVDVVINSRTLEDLKKTQEVLSKINRGKVELVVADLNTEEGRESLQGWRTQRTLYNISREWKEEV